MATTKISGNLVDLNAGRPDYSLAATNTVTYVGSSGGNQYIFNGNYGVYGVVNGTYVLSAVSSSHPIAIINNGKTSLISYTGAVNEGTGTGPDGNTYTFYSGDVTITVSGNFDTVSYYCLNHGYMGGKDNLIYTNSIGEFGLKIPSGTELNRPSTDVTGMVRNNTNETSGFSASCEEYYNGTEWKKITVVDNSAPFVAMNSSGEIEDINGNITTLSTTLPTAGPGANIEYNPNTGKYYYVGWNISPSAISSSTPFVGASWGNDSLVTSTNRTNYLYYNTASGWMFRSMTTGDPGRLNPAGDTFTTSWSQNQRNASFAFDGTNYGVTTRDISTTVGLYYSSNPASSSWTTNTNIAQDLFWCASSGSGNVLLVDDDANTIYYSSNGFNSSSFSSYTAPWTDIRQPIFYVNNKWFCINGTGNKVWYSSAALPSSSGDWSEITYPSGQTFATNNANNTIMSPRYRTVNSTYYLASGNNTNNYWTSTDGINWTAQDTGSGKFIVIANFI